MQILTRTRAAAQTARNAWDVSWWGGGVDDSQPTPSETVYDEPHALLRQFAPSAVQTGKPVLLVTPLAVPARCWDLRPEQSMVAHLTGFESGTPGRPTYVISYGAIRFADRAMGYEDWLQEIIPSAIRAISARHDGSDVHLAGWSLGGQMALLTAASEPTLLIASVVALGAPIDYAFNPAAAPLRWLDDRLGSTVMTAGTGLLGGVPAVLVQALYRGMAPTRELKKPWFLLKNLGDREALARSGAIDAFMSDMPGYPGRFYHQLHTRIVVRNEIARGVLDLGKGVTVRTDRLRVPLLFVGSKTDAIVAGPCVEAGVRAFPKAASAEYVAVDGLSHLGLIASAGARTQSWPAVAAFLAAHD
ncbi:putative hydrolase [Nocardioides baekrokdamisoli]|uniref:Putative hydrolase n=1 Tax=Nocardioides baekrokdamisoli TaxID=1804624 RepID=A0A3G9ILN2_9ACTN|nr:alpha/beta hydrolase [Nocardioides baekrokdamisoli]BBH16935.1 putative hydrolase [Nocardioides baekrokdamisoli]